MSFHLFTQMLGTAVELVFAVDAVAHLIHHVEVRWQQRKATRALLRDLTRSDDTPGRW
ncbi:hypothetical protein GCM10009839_40180 [Catenulispora yoronensis]|uniref:Uncharacterized protein n=1 Tax=Catenulispora yoronensis TaxID=450799 RepID=A0ABP5FW48_9ACTN